MHPKSIIVCDETSTDDLVNHLWTVTALQMHPASIIVCDEPSTDDLKVKTLKYFQQMEADNLKVTVL